MRTAEQERADRLAARARKKKGTKGKKEVQQFRIAGAIVAGAQRDAQNREHRRHEQMLAERESQRQANAQTILRECRDQLPRLGVYMVRNGTLGFRDAVLLIKGEYYSDKQYQWQYVTEGFVIAKKVK